MTKKIPYGNIKTVQELGQQIRQKRKELKLNQTQLAGYCNVGIRFISDLENGKPTIEFQKAIQVLQVLGLELQIVPRVWQGKIDE